MRLMTIKPFTELYAGLLYPYEEQKAERNNNQQHP
jgi:hypothetical protein